MAESTIAVTAGSGHNLHVWASTISATTVKDQFVLPGEYPYASYIALAENVSIATANDHILCLNAPSSAYVRIRAFVIEQNANASAAASAQFQIMRTTTAAPSGGTSVTPAKFDNGEAAAGATAMTGPTTKGTEGTVLMRRVNSFRATANVGVSEDAWEWVQKPGQKPIIIPSGTTNGLVIKCLTAVASATVNAWFEFVETDWLGAT